MIVYDIILLLLVVTGPIHSLVCYECSCDQDSGIPCDCGTTTEYNDPDYCVIIEQRFVSNTYVELSRIPRNATWLYVEDPYYILAVESIRYNMTTMDWSLWTTNIIYGCDWDRCNDPSLIDLLPDTFRLSIGENWLNTNIYGTGEVTRCHNCTSGECQDAENPFNETRCPLDDCINATSCLAYNLWEDLDTGEQCYSSWCLPSYLGDAEEGGKYRVDVEAIIYLAQNRSAYEIWEIDVYCAVDNCTRSTIFAEVAEQLSFNVGDLSVFPVVRPIPIPAPLTCYQCECLNASTCPCTTTTVASADDFYCVIVRESFGQYIYVYSDAYSHANSDRSISEFPYALVEESISYDERSGRWFTTTNLVIYGCNWNLCNKPEFVPLLPNSFQMRLPESWLNTSVLGSGQPARDCHQCPNRTYCGTTDYLDANVCPIQSCNTTCFVRDTYDDPRQDYLCYTSYCLRPDTGTYVGERHRIDIEGIIFASQPNVVELWEVDIYCRADNCSSPTIFRELHEQLIVQVGDLAVLFNETHDPNIPQRRCYDCYCSNTLNCSCDRTTIQPANSTYCLISRTNFGQDFWVDIGHIDQSSTRVNIREFPYLLVQESIVYSESCCKSPSSFQMRLPETWLNTSILGTGQPLRDCHDCPQGPQCGTTDFLDIGRCPIRSCNTTCVVSDTFDDPSTGLLCYQSFCVSPDVDDSETYRHRVEIEGILYLPKQSRSVELWQVKLYCRADDCSRPQIFNELEAQLNVDYGDLSVFDRIISTTRLTTVSTVTGLTTTTTGGGATTSEPPSPPPPTTTTDNAVVVSGFNFFILLLICLLPSNLY